MASIFGGGIGIVTSPPPAAEAAQGGLIEETGQKSGIEFQPELSYPVVTNPIVMEVAQALRGSSVTQDATMRISKVAELQPDGYVPVQSFQDTNSFGVEVDVRVNEASIISGGKFYVEATAKNSRNMPLDTKVIQIDHAKEKKDFLTPKIPPGLAIVQEASGRISLSVSQKDPGCSEIIIFYRVVDHLGSKKYKQLRSVNLSITDGQRLIEVDRSVSSPMIFRAVPVGPGGLGTIFTDVVALPIEASSISDSDGVLQSSISIDSIIVKAANVRGNFTSVAIAKKNLTIGESLFTQITEYFANGGSSVGVEVNDKNVQFNHSYEYKLKFLLPDGSITYSEDSEILIYKQSFEAPSFSVGRKVTTPANSNGMYGVKFSLSLNAKSTDEEIVFGALDRAGLSDLYQSEKFSAKDALSKFYLFHVTRKSLKTGKIDDMGLFPPGGFTDSGASSSQNNVNGPIVGDTYEYKVALLCNDQEQVIEELKNTSEARAKEKFKRSPYTQGRKSQSKEFNPNNTAKFFSQHSIIGSTISTGDALINNHAGGVLSQNAVGLVKTVPVGVPPPEVKIKTPRAKASHYGVVELTWKVTGDTGKIDHFIISAERPGYNYPCGVRHHYSESGVYKFIDITQARVIGSVRYSVTPVFLSFTRGQKVTIGTVAIL
jgi:hypothetical protein